MTARSSGEGTDMEPSPRTRCEMTPRFLVRTTTFNRSIVWRESFVKRRSETSSARASECSMIMSSSSPEKSGKDRHDDHTGRRDGIIADAPVGHVAAQQGNLVAGLQAGSTEDLLHAGDPASDFGIGQLLAVVHGKRNPVGEFFHAVANQSVQSIDCHNSVFITAKR